MALWKDTLIGTLIAPIAGGAIATFGMVIWSLAHMPIAGAWGWVVTGIVSGLLMGIVAGLLYGLPAMLLIGLPIHALLLRVRITSPMAYALAGGIAVAFAMTILGIPGFSRPAFEIRNAEMLPDHLSFHAFFGAVSGSVAATIFWLIRRPDRDVPNPPTSTP